MAKKKKTIQKQKSETKGLDNLKESGKIAKLDSSWFLGIKEFLREVKIEAKKVTWPEKKQVFMTALVVASISVFIGAYLGLLDVFYNFLISLIAR